MRRVVLVAALAGLAGLAVMFSGQPVTRLEAVVPAARTAAIEPPDGAVQSVHTEPGTLTSPTGEAVRTRLFWQPGAVEALNCIRHLPDAHTGVWVSTWTADVLDLELGDRLTFDVGGTALTVQVHGIFVTTWGSRAGDIDPDVPSDLAEDTDLVYLDPGVIEQLEVPTVLRWDATADQDLSSAIAELRVAAGVEPTTVTEGAPVDDPSRRLIALVLAAAGALALVTRTDDRADPVI